MEHPTSVDPDSAAPAAPAGVTYDSRVWYKSMHPVDNTQSGRIYRTRFAG